MDDKIRDELFTLESEKPIHIVNARERGSRMLGASHSDSDWDVLFLFSQDAARYATIHGRIDSIHEPHLGENEQIDLHGWNIDKFGDLLRDSNPNAIEYCRPDATEYIRFLDGGAFKEMAANAREQFNHMALYHHYISMAKRNWKKYIRSENDMSKGRQFYVARCVAAAQHLRCAGELPPLDAMELADSPHINSEITSTLQALTMAKKNGDKDEEASDLVGELYHAESEAPMEPTDERTNSPDDTLIDEFIKTAVVR